MGVVAIASEAYGNSQDLFPPLEVRLGIFEFGVRLVLG